MKNIGTKSINRSDIMLYFAMFSTIINKILYFWVLIENETTETFSICGRPTHPRPTLG